jgi:hypothetical protein
MTVQHGDRGGARAGLKWRRRDDAQLREGAAVAPKSVEWDRAVAAWRRLHSDDGARFDSGRTRSRTHQAAGDLRHVARDGAVIDDRR